MSHVTHRAQPEEAEEPNVADIDVDPLAEPKKKTKPASLVRFPNHETKELVEEAVEREGLSLNKWSVRVLVEAAKASRDHSYRSQPLEDAPRDPATTLRQGSPTPTTRITPDSFTFNPGGQNVTTRVMGGEGSASAPSIFSPSRCDVRPAPDGGIAISPPTEDIPEF